MILLILSLICAGSLGPSLLSLLLSRTGVIFSLKNWWRLVEDRFYSYQIVKIPEFHDSLQPNQLYRRETAMLAAVLRRRQYHTHPSDLFLLSLRCMSGSPRTFPGGLNKWKWKRLHEKNVRDKQYRLLEQEKPIYQARIRSEICSRLSPAAADRTHRGTIITHEAVGSKTHLRVLADRFMKEGAEDLWNEDDGPASCSPPWRIARPIDIRNLTEDDRGSSVGDERRRNDGRFGLYGGGDSVEDDFGE